MSDRVAQSCLDGPAWTICPAESKDAMACADILNYWIDQRDWMPRIHSAEDVRAFYRDFVFPNRQVWIAGKKVSGFMAMDTASDCITALYVRTPGQGLGTAFLNFAKAGRDRLQLWTFVANTGARRFYRREGFHEVRQTAGENEEGLPDVLLQWERR